MERRAQTAETRLARRRRRRRRRRGVPPAAAIVHRRHRDPNAGTWKKGFALLGEILETRIGHYRFALLDTTSTTPVNSMKIMFSRQSPNGDTEIADMFYADADADCIISFLVFLLINN